jgi:hypothetical protein
MRAGIGMLSVLIVVAIMFWFYFGPGGPGGASNMQTILNAKEQAERQANQFSGRDARGKQVSLTFTFRLVPGAQRIKGAEVTAIDADSVLATKYGLQVGDVIIEVGYIPPEQLQTGADYRIFIDDAFARSHPIKVRRAGQVIELTPGSNKGGPTDPIQQQLNVITSPR